MKNQTTEVASIETTVATVAAPAAAPAVKAKAKRPAASKATEGEIVLKSTPTVKVSGKNGSLKITGQGTIAELAVHLSEKTERVWENPTATAFVNGLVAMGGASAIGARPNPDNKRGRTAKVYNFGASIAK
jgi:hypothetical protein